MANLVVQRTAESGYRRRGISALRPTHSAGSRVLARDTDPFNETYPVSEGSFKIDMADAISRDGRTGVKGTISFTPDQRAPDSPDIRLIQAIRIIDLRTKKDVDWSKIIDTGRKGEEATRNAIETQADPLLHVDPGWYIDIFTAKVAKRRFEDEPQVTPYYRDYAPNESESHNGSKLGTHVVDASLWDFPGSTVAGRYSFETAAVDVKTGHVYGVVQWGFLSDEPQVIDKYVRPRDDMSPTMKQALKVLSDYYGNPDSATSPERRMDEIEAEEGVAFGKARRRLTDEIRRDRERREEERRRLEAEIKEQMSQRPMAFHIDESVGEDGVNSSDDVSRVGARLHELGFLDEDTTDVEKVSEALYDYQHQVLHERRPSGRVDPGSATAKALRAGRKRPMALRN